ncbi:Na/Pi cotransporter family protein [Geomonas sp. Red69]|uniref:Na/Pi cotransporter family protein n=1 Tax=Geomonas diazotrophica TaxID=2843197 RepID=A0ABX8JLP4_9BACT|nr:MULTISPECIES: Na/Pi cotransporter family protein [Geomonas]MBU5637587.1 Na/Pi cotransporter family protein [Geomonas diazotrophica]QWV99293.1 Na/Pi cotransporter family protein [Geomonas nitrogeniifigens]QXE88460.1 Na/Pi cotransporter family protein [Geomonas nitrogeniifigens]
MFPTSWSYIVEALGGLALFILGMRTMSEGLQKVTGERLRRVLERSTGNRLTAPLVGSCLASILQSGSAASVLVVGFVNAGLLSLYQALGVLLGTGIGTTLAIQFIAFRVSALALPAITVGVFLNIFSRSRKLSEAGGMLLGIGLVFFGLSILEGACLPLSESAIIAGLHQGVPSLRLVAVLLGALLTFLVQSGSATLGIVIALASAGVLSYDAAIAMVIGEVAGAALIPLIASIGGTQTAKRAVVIYLGISWVAIALALLFFPFFLKAVALVSPGDLSPLYHGAPPEAVVQALRPHIARHLANAHTIFTVASLFMFLPTIGFFARSAETLLPTRRSESEPRPRFIDVRVIKTPTIALVQAWNELARMGGIAAAMYAELVSQFDGFNPKVAAAVRDKEVVLDVLHRDMSQFLVALSRETLSLERAVEIPTMLELVNEIEQVGDQAEAILNYLMRKKEERLRFSASAMEELKRVAAKVGEVVAACEAALKGEEIQEVTDLKLEIASLESELHASHLRRLKSGKCNIVAGLLYSDIIVSFSKISQLCFSIIAQRKGLAP